MFYGKPHNAKYFGTKAIKKYFVENHCIVVFFFHRYNRNFAGKFFCNIFFFFCFMACHINGIVSKLVNPKLQINISSSSALSLYP